MTKPHVRGLAAAGAAAIAASGVVLLGGSGASATVLGPMAALTNSNVTSSSAGTNFDGVAVTAPAACDPAATRHVLFVSDATSTSGTPTDEAAIDLWVGDNLYSPSSVGLPGPITSYGSNGSWQQIADAFGQQLVPGTYSIVLRCQNNLGTTIYEEWNGGVIFSSPTAFTTFVGSPPAPTTPPVTTTPPATPPPAATPPATTPAPIADKTAPVASLTGPTAATTLGARTIVSWTGTDAVGVKSYDVRYRTATWRTALGGYVLPAALQGTTSRSSVQPVAAGALYCFSTRARDAAGNVSGWSAERCTARPLDDRALTTKGAWTRAKGKAYYGGTITSAKAKGATLTRSGAQSGRVALVAAKGKGYGKVGVYYNGQLVKTVDLSAKRTTAKAVIALPRLAKKGTVVLKVITSGKPVLIDGLLISRV